MRKFGVKISGLKGWVGLSVLMLSVMGMAAETAVGLATPTMLPPAKAPVLVVPNVVKNLKLVTPVLSNPLTPTKTPVRTDGGASQTKNPLTPVAPVRTNGGNGLITNTKPTRTDGGGSMLRPSQPGVRVNNPALDNGVDATEDETEGAAGNDASASTSACEITTELLPSPDILIRRGAVAKTLYFQKGEPAYDVMKIDFQLKQAAIVNVNIYDRSFDPRGEDNSSGLIKKIKVAEKLREGNYSVSWDGYDDYDMPVPLGDYVFEVDARTDCSYSPDISMYRFTVSDGPAEPAADTTKTCPVLSTPVVVVAAPEKVESKCPGKFYPNDIGKSPVKGLIQGIIDLCFMEGYTDGTFRPGAAITRAEATKVAVLAAGKAAKKACGNSLTCGSPFTDLDDWQRPWLGTAADADMVVGVTPTEFAPNRSITRAEAASLIARSLKIQPFSRECTDGSCGAGYPDDKFLDVAPMDLVWAGRWLRPLWDIHAVHTLKKNQFFPNKAITREEFVEILMKARTNKK